MLWAKPDPPGNPRTAIPPPPPMFPTRSRSSACPCHPAFCTAALLAPALLVLAPARAQPPDLDDVQAALAAADRTGRDLGARMAGEVRRTFWAADDSRLVYQVTGTRGTSRFLEVDPATGAITPAFDHAALARALAEAASRKVDPERLPVDRLEPATDSRRLRVDARGRAWVWDPQTGRLDKSDDPPRALDPEAPGARTRSPGNAEPSTRLKKPEGMSPDGRWIARIRRHNLVLEPADGGERVAVTTDGTAADRYTGPVHWAPDSRKLVAWRVREVEVRRVHIVESSPQDRLEPKLVSFPYPKPGDEIRQPKPRMFDLGGGAPREVALDDALYQNPWAIDRCAWAPDSSEFSFLYNKRGHQRLRIIGIAAESGAARVIHEESSRTFVDYSQKTWLHRLPESRAILWATERSGHNHLVMIDEAAGTVRAEVTRGLWNVRRVIKVEAGPQRTLELWIETVGMDPENPYHSHFARVTLDGDRPPVLTRLTRSPGHHRIEFSPNRRWLVATWSRPDHPPVVELRDAATGAKIAELARADDSALRARGWHPPERFAAPGRDGTTPIHGIIVRPTGFDPAKRYPVVEDIYAGPHSFFVPQGFRPWSGLHAMAGLGFVVVKIDGMGTNWRSKEFHDVAWKNLADSGLPDRIPWIKAAATTRPWMDPSRVGIYGGSAGGQSTAAALLHHGGFYHVGVADCGCHDNRMDKIWWNEAWMGWPVDDSYARNSNATHAAKLEGRLLLIVGELDRNVDPASTAQLAAALQRAGKHFDYLPLFNAGHGAAETPYGRLRRAEFLLRHLGRPEPHHDAPQDLDAQ